jgi:Fur family peroxide stress response transcriptional regulator
MRTGNVDAAVRAEHMLRDLKRTGLKMTPQRIAIVKLFAGDDTHPTAQDIFERLRPEFPSMSFATVYNTLDALAERRLAGIVRLSGTHAEGLAGGSAARFDPNTTPHHHAVCDRCGAVLDLPAGTLSPSPAAVSKMRRAAPGFALRSVERVYRGLCPRCAKDEK